MEKSLIVAVADNGAIGRKNALLWNLPGDMRYFRRQTTGNAVIMGWMTFQSIGRPLPKRHNIVISLFPWPEAPAEVTVVDSLDAAFDAAEKEIIEAADGAGCSASLRDPIRANAPQPAPSAAPVFSREEGDEKGRKAFVIGGAYTYAEAVEVVDTMYITHVHDAPEDADAFFPPIDPAVWAEESRSEMQTDPGTGITYEFAVYRRRKAQ